MCSGEKEDPAGQCSERLHLYQLGTWRIASSKYYRAACAFRRGGQSSNRACLLQPVQRDSYDLPEYLDRKHRYRVEHNRGKHSYRAIAHSVSVSCFGAAEPAGRAQEDERTAGAAGAHASRVRRAAAKSAGRASKHQRRAPGKGNTSGATKVGSRGQESRGRRGSLGDRRKSRTACSYLKIQIRIYGQYVSWIANAA